MAVARRTPYIRAALLQLPLFLLMFGMASLSMMVPALHALIVDNETTARAFFYAGLVGMVTFALIAIAHAGRNMCKAGISPSNCPDDGLPVRSEWAKHDRIAAYNALVMQPRRVFRYN